MSIFNTLAGGGGGGLIDAELVSTTTGEYSTSGNITIASTPPITFSSDYTYAVDIRCNETVTTTRNLLRFFGLIGQRAISNTSVREQGWAAGVAVLYNFGQIVSAYCNTQFDPNGATNFWCTFYDNSDARIIAKANTTYTIKFYKITLPQ